MEQGSRSGGRASKSLDRSWTRPGPPYATGRRRCVPALAGDERHRGPDNFHGRIEMRNDPVSARTGSLDRKRVARSHPLAGVVSQRTLVLCVLLLIVAASACQPTPDANYEVMGCVHTGIIGPLPEYNQGEYQGEGWEIDQVACMGSYDYKSIEDAYAAGWRLAAVASPAKKNPNGRGRYVLYFERPQR